MSLTITLPKAKFNRFPKTQPMEVDFLDMPFTLERPDVIDRYSARLFYEGGKAPYGFEIAAFTNESRYKIDFTNGIPTDNGVGLIFNNTSQTNVDGDISASISGVKWGIDSTDYHSSPSSACTFGEQLDNEESMLSIEGNFSDGQISFWLKVSSEKWWDYLIFSIDDVIVSDFYTDNWYNPGWSGEVGWKKVDFNINSGWHVLTWKFSKDSYMSRGYNRAWIDDILLPVSDSFSTIDITHDENEKMITMSGFTYNHYSVFVTLWDANDDYIYEWIPCELFRPAPVIEKILPPYGLLSYQTYASILGKNFSDDIKSIMLGFKKCVVISTSENRIDVYLPPNKIINNIDLYQENVSITDVVANQYTIVNLGNTDVEISLVSNPSWCSIRVPYSYSIDKTFPCILPYESSTSFFILDASDSITVGETFNGEIVFSINNFFEEPYEITFSVWLTYF